MKIWRFAILLWAQTLLICLLDVIESVKDFFDTVILKFKN